MAAFDKIESGIPQFDTAIDNIRLGDNVVRLVDTIDTFLKFALPYVDQAIKDHRSSIFSTDIFRNCFRRKQDSMALFAFIR